MRAAPSLRICELDRRRARGRARERARNSGRLRQPHAPHEPLLRIEEHDALGSLDFVQGAPARGAEGFAQAARRRRRHTTPRLHLDRRPRHEELLAHAARLARRDEHALGDDSRRDAAPRQARETRRGRNAEERSVGAPAARASRSARTPRRDERMRRAARRRRAQGARRRPQLRSRRPRRRLRPLRRRREGAKVPLAAAIRTERGGWCGRGAGEQRCVPRREREQQWEGCCPGGSGSHAPEKVHRLRRRNEEIKVPGGTSSSLLGTGAHTCSPVTLDVARSRRTRAALAARWSDDGRSQKEQKKYCHEPGSNQRPSDLQSDALPTGVGLTKQLSQPW